MLERTNAQPLYIQARNILLSRLENEEYRANEKMPSESELCREFGISRATLRSVLTELVRDGWIYRIQGKGTFVAEPKITAGTMSYVGIREQLEEQGYDVTTNLLEIKTIPCTKHLAKIMNLRANDPVYYIQRLRRVKGTVLSIHNSYVPALLCPGVESSDLCNTQLCCILSTRYGLNRANSVEILESVSARNDEAELLGVKPGMPLLLLQNTVTDDGGRVFEYSKILFRGDRIRIRLDHSS